MSLDLEHVKAAAARLLGQVVRTPCLPTSRLSGLLGCQISLKYEIMQHTGAYKERGALNRLLALSEDEKRRGVIAASAGNHAQGLAYHAKRLGIPVTIVMPDRTPFMKVERTRGFGAEVVQVGETYDESLAYTHQLAAERDLIIISAFDDPLIIAGQGTCALEMLEDQPDLDALIIPIGGGGLIAGTVLAAKALKPEIEIYGVQAQMYPSFKDKAAGFTLPRSGPTLAEGIAVKTCGELTFATAYPHLKDILLVDETALEQAVAMLISVEKAVCEGAGAAGLAAILAHPHRFAGKKVGLILTGGNIDTRLLASVLQRELVRDKRLVTFHILGDDRPGMLALMAEAIGRAGGNIVDVAHNRLALDVPAKGAEFDIVVETQGTEHAFKVGEALRKTGYALRMD